jgi:hypothetical protein
MTENSSFLLGRVLVFQCQEKCERIIPGQVFMKAFKEMVHRCE